MTGEIKDDICGSPNCEICELLNGLYSDLKDKKGINIVLDKEWEKYGVLFQH